jgi:uncharacterized protein
MQTRREAILQSITEQGKLTPALQQALLLAATKQELEDLYLPYKPKRRTKGMIAREAGLEALADLLWADPTLEPVVQAQAFVLKPDAIEGADFSTVQAVLDGVRDLLSERWAEDAGLLALLREWLWAEASLHSQLAKGKDETHPDVAKFRDYLDYQEPLCKVPSHRALAVFRGRALELLDAKMWVPETQVAPDSKAKPESVAIGRIAGHLKWRHQHRAADDLLRRTVGIALQEVAHHFAVIKHLAAFAATLTQGAAVELLVGQRGHVVGRHELEVIPHDDGAALAAECSGTLFLQSRLGIV